MENRSLMKILIMLSMLIAIQAMVWFSTNLQLVKGFDESKAFLYCVIMAIPISITSFYATRIGYSALESLWSLKLIGHATGYLVFPFLTWFLLSESPFNFKTMSCIFLGFTIVLIQIFYPN